MNVLIDASYRAEDIEALPIRQLCLHNLAMQEAPTDTEVSLTFVTDEEIQRLNKEYRDLDRPTDVLSFECDGLDYDGILGLDYVLEDAEDGDDVFCLGDIVIAPDVATRQTQEFGTDFQEEVELLVVHGLLHLCGYDHIDPEDAELMKAREQEVLSAWREGHETLL